MDFIDSLEKRGEKSREPLKKRGCFPVKKGEKTRKVIKNERKVFEKFQENFSVKAINGGNYWRKGMDEIDGESEGGKQVVPVTDQQPGGNQ